MSQPGITVMMNYLLGSTERSVEAFQRGRGKTITDLKFIDDALVLTFDDGYQMELSDDGQSCCEHRYMVVNDDLGSFIGSSLLNVEIVDAPEREDDGGIHEIQFLNIKTSRGIITAETHNEHNGYYGGFSICIRAIE